MTLSLHKCSPNSLSFIDQPRIFVSERNWKWSICIPDYFNVWIALRGHGTFTVDGQPFHMGPGTAFVLAPGQNVEATHDPEDPIHNFAAHFNVQGTGAQRLSIREFPLLGVRVRNMVLMDALTRHLTRLPPDPSEGPYAQRVWLYALLQELIRSHDEPELNPMAERMRRWAERISSSPGHPHRVSEMARREGLSRIHFTRVFTRTMGESPQEFIIRRRVDRAAHLIENSPLSLAEIAETLGYSDVFFFSRQFKQIKGLPPSRLRAKR